MNLVQRIQDILLKPKAAWPEIEQEGGDTRSIYTGYVMILAAIPALAGFIGLSLIGVGAFGVGFRVPIVSGLTQMVVGYVMSLVAVFVLALIADALAPTFGGTKSRINALKVVAYGSTAGFVGGIFSLLPSLSILGLLAALYSIYLVYLGLPALMKCPPEKAVGYTAVMSVCGIVAMAVLGLATSLVLPTGGLGAGRFGRPANVSISSPDGQVTIDTAKLAQARRAIEAAGAGTGDAKQQVDPAAAGKAMGAMLGALAGGNAATIAAADLKALLPEAVGDLQRVSVEAQGGQAMGVGGSSAKARYGNGGQQVQLSITDLGGLGALANVAGWANMTVDKETTDGVEKVYKDGDRTVREAWRKDGSHGEYTVILASGVIVEGHGDHVGMGRLKSVVGAIDTGRIDALKKAAKPAG